MEIAITTVLCKTVEGGNKRVGRFAVFLLALIEFGPFKKYIAAFHEVLFESVTHRLLLLLVGFWMCERP